MSTGPIEMFDAVETARDAGVDLGFFGANAVYWQVRFERSTDGAPERIMVCYKDAGLDPLDGSRTTVRWRDPPVNRPEQTLIGIQYGLSPVDAPYVVANSSHWAYAGTGLSDGDAIQGIVGYEADHFHPAYPGPVARTYTTLSRSPVGGGDVAESSIYQAPSGAWVFAAGTIWWSYGLDAPGSRGAAHPVDDRQCPEGVRWGVISGRADRPAARRATGHAL